LPSRCIASSGVIPAAVDDDSTAVRSRAGPAFGHAWHAPSECEGVGDRHPGRRLQLGTQHIAGFVKETILFVSHGSGNNRSDPLPSGVVSTQLYRVFRFVYFASVLSFRLFRLGP
jgi:hypothetical protein